MDAPREVPEEEVPPTASRQHEQFAATRQMLADAIAARVFPGCAWGVLFGGEVRALDSLGRFTYDHGSHPVAANTVYDLASLTKVLATTAIAMLLYDRKLLDLDQPIVHWLPAFVAAHPGDKRRREVTAYMLLTHSSGLPGYAPLFEQSHSADALFDACLRIPLEQAPGTGSEYSDLGFILLGRILEDVAGAPLDETFHREIALPLEMQSMHYCPPPTWKNAIPPTQDDTSFRRRVVQGEVHDDNAFVLGGVSGHAGLFSNAFDPLRFARCLLAGGRTPENKQLFQEETVRLFTTRARQPQGASRALGWDTPSAPSSSGRFFSERSFGHLGFTGTSLWIDPDAELAVVLLSNRTWPDGQNQAIKELRPRFHDSVVSTLLPEVPLLSKARAWVTS
ncbi:MAG: serine hydrolase domain-containing protein [Acidobacteriaceae bacterium]